MEYVLLIFGFVLLTLCADWLVEGATAVARKFNISDLVIGLTIVAFGTSMPEFIVNIIASIDGNNEIAMTNILGSNTLNTLVIVGLTAVVCPIYCSKEVIRFELPLSIIGAVLVMLLGSECFGKFCVSNYSGMQWWDGLILLVGFSFFMFYTVRNVIRRKKTDGEDEPLILNEKPMWQAVLLIIIGLAGLTVGGKLIVENATLIAKNFGVSDAVIGATIVALGTSLPELATSVMAAFKKNTDLAIGNVVGSNIFNIFFILGVSSCVSQIEAYENLLVDSMLALFSGIMLMAFLLDDDNRHISRWEGGVLLLIYVGYVYLLVK
ncbi:MAG: calcium/sodium antiporter [Paludibacteraceae bacterium]|nr:calcium/sodium antiporter [Paludibacteraceae bacterium]